MVENLQKGPKKLTKSLVFKHFKMAFHFWTRVSGLCKKKEKQRQKSYECFILKINIFLKFIGQIMRIFFK
jgi:hypothetical protein